MASAADRFAERRQERLRGAGTHAIVQRGLDLFASITSPLRSSRQSDSARDDVSDSLMGGTSSNMEIASSFDRSASRVRRSIDASSLMTPQNFSRDARSMREPQSVASVLSASESRSLDASYGRRPAAPTTSSPSRNIDPRLLYADFDDAVMDENATPTRATRATVTASRQDTLPTAGPSRSPIASTMAPSMAQRRQERVRGAGTYQIAPRKADFPRPSEPSGLSESGDDEEEQVAGVVGAGVALDLEQRRRERMRGAGTHAVEARQIAFALQSPSMSTSLQSVEASTSFARPEQQVAADYDIEERRLQRLRGAGNHAIARRSVSFAQDVTRDESTNTSDTRHDEASIRSQYADGRELAPSAGLGQRRLERMRGAGNVEIARRDIGFDASLPDSDSSVPSSPAIDEEERQDVYDGSAMQMDTSQYPDTSRQLSTLSTPNGSGIIIRKRPAMDDDEYEDLYEAPDSRAHTFDAMDDDNRASMEPVESDEEAAAAHERAMAGRFDVQITGKRGRGRPRKPDAKRRRGKHQLVRQELADQTVVGDADVTMTEERQNILQRVARPLAPWTLSKAAVTPTEVTAMRKELRGAVNLALGKVKADRLRAVRLNDADVLWSAVKKQLSDEGMPWMRKELLPAVLDTFTRLSRQTAARAQLVMQLREARKTKIAMRKAVFAKRRRVLVAQRAIDALVAAETQRTQRAVAAASMNTFLRDLRHVARENWT